MVRTYGYIDILKAFILTIGLISILYPELCFGQENISSVTPTAIKPQTKSIVQNVDQLYQALSKANKNTHGTDIVLEKGTYLLDETLYILADNITLRSASRNPTSVIIQGPSMSASAPVGNLLRVSGKHFTLEGLTLQKAGNHLVQIAGEEDADNPHIRHCILRDAYQQLIKVSTADDDVSSDRGVVEHNLFEYSAGIGPQWYIGGIDAHSTKNWLVQHNVFRNIASPSQQVAQYAIHFWNHSADNTVAHNTIIDCDRGIGFGMKDKPNQRGIIRNNRIEHAKNHHPYADVGIALEDSSHTKVHDNTVTLHHPFRWSIEYRWPSSTNNEIYRNTVNRPIISRNGGQAKVFENNYK